jgi:hypothetical protein
MTDEQLAAAEALVRPARLWTRQEVLARPSPVPAAAGIYAWYFSTVPIAVDTSGCVELDGWRLLYVGISPKPPPANGTAASRQQLRSRLRQHYRGNAAGSTLRLTLGCLLASELGLQLRRVGSGQRLTFADGEQVLSAWMGRHARGVLDGASAAVGARAEAGGAVGSAVEPARQPPASLLLQPSKRAGRRQGRRPSPPGLDSSQPCSTPTELIQWA